LAQGPAGQGRALAGQILDAAVSITAVTGVFRPETISRSQALSTRWM